MLAIHLQLTHLSGNSNNTNTMRLILQQDEDLQTALHYAALCSQRKVR
jgi:ankyrin repeat protein